MGQLISKFIGHVLPGIVRPLHALWNEVIGFLFLVFAVVAGFYVFRALRNFDGDIEGLVHIVFPALFGLVMGYFGVSSFLTRSKDFAFMSEPPAVPRQLPIERPESFLTRAESTKTCTGRASGPCANTPVSGPLKKATSAIGILLSQGTTGLSVAFDLPTQMGMDPDHPLAAGRSRQSGRVDRFARRYGAAVRQIPARENQHVDDDQLDRCDSAVALRAGGARPGRRRQKTPGHHSERHSEGIHRARHLYLSPAPGDAHHHRSVRLGRRGNARVEHDLDQRVSHSRSRIDRDSGSRVYACRRHRLCRSGGQRRVWQWMRSRPRLSFFFNAHNDFLEEIAKFRAARRLWARIMKDRFGAKIPESMMLRFHAQTAGSTLTAQQPDVNVVRVTLQALAAVLGGAQSLHTNSRDEALGLPTPEAARLALRTQQVIAHESGVTAVPDPLGGSEYIEKLTDEIERGAEAYIERIDEMGGTLARDRRRLHPTRNSERRLTNPRRRLKPARLSSWASTALRSPESGFASVFKWIPASSNGKWNACATCEPPRFAHVTVLVSMNWRSRARLRESDATHSGVVRSASNRRRNLRPPAQSVWRISKKANRIRPAHRGY